MKSIFIEETIRDKDTFLVSQNDNYSIIKEFEYQLICQEYR